MGFNKNYDLVKTGKRIRMLRQLRQMTLTELADLMNCSLDHLSRAESGQRGLSIENLLIISEEFKVSLNWLVTGEPVEEKFPSQIEEVIKLLQEIAGLEDKDDNL